MLVWSLRKRRYKRAHPRTTHGPPTDHPRTTHGPPTDHSDSENSTSSLNANSRIREAATLAQTHTHMVLLLALFTERRSASTFFARTLVERLQCSVSLGEGLNERQQSGGYLGQKWARALDATLTRHRHSSVHAATRWLTHAAEIACSHEAGAACPMERCIAVVKIMRMSVFKQHPEVLASRPGVFAIVVKRSARQVLCSLSWAKSTHDYAQHPDERLISGTHGAYQAHLRDCLAKSYNSEDRDAWFRRLRQLHSVHHYDSFENVTRHTERVISVLARKLNARLKTAPHPMAVSTPAPPPLSLGIATIVTRKPKALTSWISHHLKRAGCAEIILYWNVNSEEARPVILDNRVRTFEAREAAEEGRGRIWWKRYTRPFHRLEHLRPLPNSTAVESRVFMPEQALCFKHALRRFNTTWMLFIDLDEFVIGNVLRLISIMQVRPNRPDGLWLSQLQMTTANECLTPRPESVHLQYEFKHLVRRAGLHPDPSFFGSIHNVVLAPGAFSAKVNPNVVAIAHFRYHQWNMGAKRARLRELGCFPSPADSWRRFVCSSKAIEVADWSRQLLVRTRTRLSGAHQLTQLRPSGARVLIVAEMRSGSTWFAQRVFGARDDVLYLYEPCRAVGAASECVRLISRLMACRISLQDWRMLRKDRDARYVYSTLGAYTKLGIFLDMCYSRHLVLKVVRTQHVTREALNPSNVLIIHLHREASRVVQSRMKMLPAGASLRLDAVLKSQTLLRDMANLSVSLSTISKDPEGVALSMHRLAGMVPRRNLSCARPERHSWAPCAGWQRRMPADDI